MVFKGKISPEKRALSIFLRRESGMSFPKIAEKCNISISSAERICKENISPRKKPGQKRKSGRPRKISIRMKRLLKRNLLKLRREGVAVTVKRLVAYSGLSLQTASIRSYSRCLNEMGFWFLQSRKKGLLKESDKKERLQCSRKMERFERDNPRFWNDEVAFYLDGVSFVYKNNPMSAAMTPKARDWRKKSEGLQITSKGSKDLAGGKRLHVMVAIAYGKGVILNEPYDKMNGIFFADFIRQHFNLCFGRAGPKRDGKRVFIMDNDPSQVSKLAMNALREIECELSKIPSRSPDLNPCESIFHIVKGSLDNEAIERNINKESFDDFQTRVLRTLDEIDTAVIDKTIESMPTRIKLIIEGKGCRTKY